MKECFINVYTTSTPDGLPAKLIPGRTVYSRAGSLWRLRHHKSRAAAMKFARVTVARIDTTHAFILRVKLKDKSNGQATPV